MLRYLRLNMKFRNKWESRFKFRVWHLNDKIWINKVYPDSNIDFESKMVSWNWCYDYYENEASFGNEVIVQQYALVKDIEGKEVYEGDIVEYDGGEIQEWTMYPGKHICEIIWENNQFMIKSKHFKWGFDKSLNIKVIGNIFEKP